MHCVVLVIQILLLGQINLLKIRSSFPITSTSPYGRPEVEIKSYLFVQSGHAITENGYKDVLTNLELEAKELCANAIMDFSWTQGRSTTDKSRFYGFGTAVCDPLLFTENQTECSCV